ncbi:hypothetical protein B4U79_05991 [Dinothrombium tinctorium]|uniref:Uncharacterized protein n=1 Tax=Dinothrombium tinctorium TaxID=1965070 RepID=A0A3S3SM75_9ACAR|nr:hypothetical protein B4U79_05991 [Dinothrombium tinctorium]
MLWAKKEPVLAPTSEIVTKPTPHHTVIANTNQPQPPIKNTTQPSWIPPVKPWPPAPASIPGKQLSFYYT